MKKKVSEKEIGEKEKKNKKKKWVHLWNWDPFGQGEEEEEGGTLLDYCGKNGKISKNEERFFSIF